MTVETDEVLVNHIGPVAYLTFNRPEKRNALRPSSVVAAIAALHELAGSDSVRALIVRGEGGEAFCSGYDISDIPTGAAVERAAARQSLAELKRTLHEFPHPVAAMIEGYAIGVGLDIATCCDFRFVADGSRLGITPAKLGIVYDVDGLSRILGLVGPARAKYLLLSGRLIDAETAHDWQLVDEVAPPADIEAVTHGLMAEIAGNAPLSVVGMKQILNALVASNGPTPAVITLAEGLAEVAYRSEDLLEGQRAFAEKRRPIFHGR